MEFNQSDIEDGFRLANSRILTHGLRELTEQESQGLLQRVSSVFNEYSTQWSSRGIGLFTELSALSEATRLTHGEPELTTGELQQFLEQSTVFFNTFTHA